MDTSLLAQAHLAQDAYRLPPTFTGAGLDQDIHVVVDDDVISFRGSADLQNWLRDFFAIGVRDHRTETHWKLGRIHAGALIGALSVYDRYVRPLAEKRRDAGLSPLRPNGHSLGGGLALVTGALLVADGLPVGGITAFEPLRVGLDDYVRLLAPIAVVETRCGNDMVPSLPPDLLHARQPFQFGKPHHLDPIKCHLMETVIAELTALPIAA